RLSYVLFAHLQISGGLLEDDLAHISRIDGHPAEPVDPDLRSTMLCACNVRRPGPQALVAEPRGPDPEAVDMARGKAAGPCKPDIERVQVGAVAPQVPGLEHRLDIAGATAPGSGLANRVVDDPVVERPCLVQF